MGRVIGALTGANAAADASNRAAAATRAEQQRQANITSASDQVNTTFNNQFNDDFYKQQQQNYLDYAMPQLNTQYSDAQKQLTFALARSGNLDSSARSSQQADLQRQYDANQQSLQSAAGTAANGIKSNVEAARSGLIANLDTSGDTAAATSNAISQAAALSQTPKYSALGNLFATTTATLAQAADTAKQNAMTSGGAYSSPYNFGLNRSNGAVVSSP